MELLSKTLTVVFDVIMVGIILYSAYKTALDTLGDKIWRWSIPTLLAWWSKEALFYGLLITVLEYSTMMTFGIQYKTDILSIAGTYLVSVADYYLLLAGWTGMLFWWLRNMKCGDE